MARIAITATSGSVEQVGDPGLPRRLRTGPPVTGGRGWAPWPRDSRTGRARSKQRAASPSSGWPPDMMLVEPAPAGLCSRGRVAPQGRNCRPRSAAATSRAKPPKVGRPVPVLSETMIAPPVARRAGGRTAFALGGDRTALGGGRQLTLLVGGGSRSRPTSTRSRRSSRWMGQRQVGGMWSAALSSEALPRRAVDLVLALVSRGTNGGSTRRVTAACGGGGDLPGALRYLGAATQRGPGLGNGRDGPRLSRHGESDPRAARVGHGACPRGNRRLRLEVPGAEPSHRQDRLAGSTSRFASGFVRGDR